MNAFAKLKILEEKFDGYLDDRIRGFVKSHPRIMPLGLMICGVTYVASSCYEFYEQKQDIASYLKATVGIAWMGLGYSMLKENKRMEG